MLHPSFPADFRPIRSLGSLLLLLGALMLAGCNTPAPVAPTATTAAAQTETATPMPTFTSTPLPATATPVPAVKLGARDEPAAAVLNRIQIETVPDGRVLALTDEIDENTNVLAFAPLGSGGHELVEFTFAVAAPFDTVRDSITWAELQAQWLGAEQGSIQMTPETAAMLTPAFGAAPNLSADSGDLAILPFDQLDPTLKVLAIDGVRPLSNQFEAESYPLTVALTLSGPDADLLAPLLADVLPPANRDPDQLTQLIMTGVTAMSRGTAEKMEEKGYDYPARVIADTLSAADITHVSNEVPFIEGCPVNNTYMNLTLCSDYTYWQTLEAIGTDIVGLSGNHVNDFGYDGARESIAFYRNRDIPIYGSGLNTDEACAPLLWQDHGNTFAFIAALAYWPDSAWATDELPGACYFYDNDDRILDDIRRLSTEVDIVAVELQFYETYNPWPVPDQVAEFRELRAAGADIVTGVQSHVPQALEPYGASETGGNGVILYGLGNLFFDQMEAWDTRTGLIARHTIYEGRLLSTEILTAVLEDFAQPRWATPDERAGILRSIFAAAPDKDSLPTPVPTETPEAAAIPAVETDDQTTEQPTDQPTPVPAPTPEPGPPWPVPVEQPEEHYWLARPTAPEANGAAAPTYPFGGTAGGRYRVHHGVDIANPMGTALFAPDAATIIHAGPDQPPAELGPYPDFFGNAILFRLDRTWRDQPVFVLYGHLNTVDVEAGQHVERGQPMGTVGMTGIATGPHVHVEVRLGAPGYDNSYHSELWLEPFFGYGTLAGQVVTPDGRAWPEVRVLIYRLSEDGYKLHQIVPTYAADPGIHPDPDRAENFVLADVPAGEYDLVVKLRDQTITKRLTVESGRTAYAQFVIAP